MFLLSLLLHILQNNIKANVDTILQLQNVANFEKMRDRTRGTFYLKNIWEASQFSPTNPANDFLTDTPKQRTN